MNKHVFAKINAIVLLIFSGASIAQETVEVGRHANPNIDAASMIMSLLMVLILIFASAWLLKKFNVVNNSVTGMKVISSLSLGNKEKLIVVQVADEQLLLGVSSQQITLIKVLEQPLEVGAPMTKNFGQTLTKFFTKSSKTQS
jgi:flagellar protein FliO/FliZ